MCFELQNLHSENITRFKKDLKEAFQQGAIDELGKMETEVMPESEIDRSLNAQGAVAYEAFVDGKSAGGAVVLINKTTGCNQLELLYVKNDIKNQGVGFEIWNALESLYRDTKVWKTFTPYFDKRNIHFYVNKCGFHIVEFFNKHHPNPDEPYDETAYTGYFTGIFQLEKIAK